MPIISLTNPVASAETLAIRLGHAELDRQRRLLQVPSQAPVAKPGPLPASRPAEGSPRRAG